MYAVVEIPAKKKIICDTELINMWIFQMCGFDLTKLIV